MTEAALQTAAAPAPFVAPEGAGARQIADGIMARLAAERQPQDSGADTVTGDDQTDPTPDATAEASEGEGDGEVETAEAEASEDTASKDKGAEQQDQAKPEVYTVKVDGEELKVTRDELLKGYSRTEDYNRKTARLAEERRSVEAEKASFTNQVNEIRTKAEAQIAEAIAQASEDALIVNRGDKTDWRALSDSDPVKAQSDWFAYQQAKTRVDNFKAQQESQKKTESDQSKAQRDARIAEQARLAAEKIPEFADPEKGPKFISDLQGYLAEHGLTPDEIGGISDHRMLTVARDAMLYRQMLANQKAAAAKKVEAAPKVMDAKRSSGVPEADAKISNLKKQALKTGKAKDAHAAAMAILRS